MLKERQLGLRPTRISVNIPVTYYLKGNEAEGTIVDISSGGVGLEVRQILVNGDIIRINMQLYGKNVDFWGIVRNVNGNFVGVKFEEISNENRELLLRFIEELIHFHGAGPTEHFLEDT